MDCSETEINILEMYLTTESCILEIQQSFGRIISIYIILNTHNLNKSISLGRKWEFVHIKHNIKSCRI